MEVIFDGVARQPGAIAITPHKPTFSLLIRGVSFRLLPGARQHAQNGRSVPAHSQIEPMRGAHARDELRSRGDRQRHVGRVVGDGEVLP